MGVNYQKVGERMKTLRELKKLSLADLEQQTNFTQKSIILAESGKAVLNLDFLVQVSDALGVTPNDILVGQYKTTDVAAADKDALINGFLMKINEIQNGGTGTGIKSKDTDVALAEIKKMVDDHKRGEQEANSANAATSRRYFTGYR